MAIWFLDHVADPNRQCSIDVTPLSMAVANAPFSIIQTLFGRGGDVQNGELLQHALDRQADVVDVLAFLLEKGASLNKTMYQDHPWAWRIFLFSGLGTPLHKAAKLGKLDAVEFLLSQVQILALWIGSAVLLWNGCRQVSGKPSPHWRVLE